MTEDVDRYTLPTDSRNVSVNLGDSVQIAKALASEVRVRIFQEIAKRPMNVLEIAERCNLPPSTAAINVRKLEEAGLISTVVIPGTRGTQKICNNSITRIIINVTRELDDAGKHVMMTMPIGEFVDCQVSPTCGMVSETSVIGEFDDPRLFYDPDRIHAQLIWFRRGYLEYRFPNRVPKRARPSSLELTMEICSEAPMFNEHWPSDITVWINGQECGTWTSPGDFGGERGVLTPDWWGVHNTQYGLLKSWRITAEGTFIDGIRVSGTTILQLDLVEGPFVSVRIGVKQDAANDGGINLFGRKFGNYDTDIMFRIDYRDE